VRRFISQATIIPVILLCALWPQRVAGGEDVFPRPPAAPLVTHDPYFSIWSMSDRLTDSWTKHWTGRPQPLAAMLRVDDGTAYRLMGPEPRQVPPMTQTSLRIFPTRTVYSFDGAGLNVTVSFLSPLLVQDLDILARPVSYVTVSVRSVDGRPIASPSTLTPAQSWRSTTPLRELSGRGSPRRAWRCCPSAPRTRRSWPRKVMT